MSQKKADYNKQYYQKHKEKLLEINRENQRSKYANEEQRESIKEKNRQRYAERKEALQFCRQNNLLPQQV